MRHDRDATPRPSWLLALCAPLGACAAGEVASFASDAATRDDLATTRDAALDGNADAAPRVDVADAPEGLDSPPVTDAPVDARDATPDRPTVALRVAQRDVPVTPRGSVRQPDVAFHAGADAFVAAYTWVLPGAAAPRFRVEARALTLRADGTPVPGEALGVDGDAPAHDADEPSVAAPDRAGLPALVTWIDDRAGPGGRGMIEVYGRLVRVRATPTPAVEAAGEVFAISQRPGTDERLPAAAWDAAAGTFLVAWADDRERGVRHEDARVVYARAVSPEGRVGPELRLGDDGLFQTYPHVASCNDGRFLVTWTDYRNDGATLVSQARGRLVDARTGAALSPILLWGEARGLPQDDVPVQCAPDGDGWVVAWTVPGPPSLKQLRWARLARDGAVRDGPFGPSAQPDGARAARLASVPAAGQVVLSHLAQDSTNGYVLALAPGAFPSPTPLTPTAPRLGTFWSAAAASTLRPEVLVVMTLDYERLHATTLTAAP